MQFTIPAAFLALIGSAFAQTANFDAITSPTKGQQLVADGKQSYKIVWDPTTAYNGQTVSILLLQGASQDTLDFYPGANVASSIDSALGTYTWTPSSSIAGYATYGLKLQLDSNTTIFQYSFPFQITAGSTSTSVVSSGTTTLSSIASISTNTAATSTSVPSKDNAASTTTTSAASASVTSTTVVASTGAATATGSGSGSGSGAQTTLTTTTKPSSTGSSTGSASGSSTSGVVTAGAGKVMAGGVAAIGGLMAAMFVL